MLRQKGVFKCKYGPHMTLVLSYKKNRVLLWVLLSLQYTTGREET